MKTTPAQLTLAFAIVQRVCSATGVTMSDIESHRRPWEIVWARHMAISLVRRQTGWGGRRLGAFFGRTPGAILRASRQVADLTATEPRLAAQYHSLLASLAGGAMRCENCPRSPI
jgi:chromosomal replication initiation ATPase DnaA